MLKSKKYPDVAAVPSLRAFVASEMRAAAFDGRYDYGTKLEVADEMMDELGSEDERAISREQRRVAASERLTIIKQRLADATQEWNDRLNRLRQDHGDRVYELENSHRSEVEKFEKQWQEGEFRLEYSKPSPTLINLRFTERQLALMKQFEKAKMLRGEAERKEKDEASCGRQRAIATMKIEFENMDARQKREMECLLLNSKRHMEVTEAERDKELKPLQILVERLTPQASPAKIRDRKKEGVWLDETVPNPVRPIWPMQRAGTITSTYSLEIQGITMRKHIKLKKPTSARAASKKKKTNPSSM
jgi:hypothetical protein